jgi:hypothetical protein
MPKRWISIQSSKDAGCPITEEEHAKWCELVAKRVSEVYQCEAECTAEDTGRTTAYVSGFPSRDEDDVKRGAEAIAQEVWEEGEFWE